MSTETPTETSSLVVSEAQNTRTSSLRGLKTSFFMASVVGSMVSIVPSVMGAINGQTEVYPSVLTAAFSTVALGVATVNYILDNKNKSTCASHTLLIGLQGFATVATEVASIASLMKSQNAFLSGMAVVGGVVMNSAGVGSATLNCVKK